jgi:hypothetical protein
MNQNASSGWPSGSSNFSGGKTDNPDMRTKWRDPICDRAAAPSRREKANA